MDRLFTIIPVILLVVFIVSATISGFLMGTWQGFAALAIGSLVSSVLLGSD